MVLQVRQRLKRMLLISWDECKKLQKDNNFSKCEKCLERFTCWTSKDIRKISPITGKEYIVVDVIVDGTK